jgi:hypothetical protein
MGGIVQTKWLTRGPILKQTTTIHFLNAETLNQEDIVLTPVIVGGVNLVLLGTAALALAATEVIATITHKNRTTPALLSVTVASAAGIVAGQKCINTTRNSAARVSSVVGTTITFDQPFTLLTPASADFGLVPSEDDAWAAGNTLKFYTLPLVNLKILGVRGGDNNAADTACVCWMQDMLIPDTGGAPGLSTFTPNSPDVYLNLVDCEIQPFLVTLPGAGDEASATFVNVGLPGDTDLSFCSFYGGEIAGGSVGGFSLMDFDTVLAGAFFAHGAENYVGEVYVGVSYEVFVGASIIPDNLNVACFIWGPGSFANLGYVNSRAGNYATIMLVKGALTLDGAATATKAVLSTTWTFTGGIALTPANIDANGGLQNPLTGHRYS